MDDYIPVIGLEVHAQLQTESKIFAADSARYGASPNTQVSPITLGHPGILPKLNRRALEYAIKMGIACRSTISRFQIFDRKNYFYPDLPKGYQITQDKTPVCVGGELSIKPGDGSIRTIRLNRIHLEEDAGKSMHQPGGDSLVDLNRAGVPLIELVTEPDLRSSEEAYLIMSEIRKIIRYLGISDGNMEEGSLRCDANVSVMKKGDSLYGQKVEIKNMNSFRHVQKAINYEIERQVKELKQGRKILSETRTYDSTSGKTFGMRIKEELNDYRYFPDPDLSPVELSEEWLKMIKQNMPALPHELAALFQEKYGLPEYDAAVLTETREVALYFREVCDSASNYKMASNWMMGPVKSYLNEHNVTIDEYPVSPKQLAALINLIFRGEVSNTTAAKEVYPALLKDPEIPVETFIHERDLSRVIDADDLSVVVQEVLRDLPEKVRAYKNGKKGLLGLFMGEVMKKTKGKADPGKAQKLIKELLHQ